MHSSFRFGQPIGSALITLAIADTIVNVFWLLLRYFNLEYIDFALFFDGESYEFYTSLQWHFIICIRPLLSLLFWTGVVLWGKKIFLIVWIFLSLLADIGLITNVILNYLQTKLYAESTLMYVSIAVFIIFRIYITLVALQGLVRLHRKYDFTEEDNVSDIDVCLEPIGFGIWQTLNFYKELPGMGALILLTADLVWNMVNLGTREMASFAFGMKEIPIINLDTEYFPGSYLLVEETGMRYVRIFMAVVGIIFLKMERVNHVRIWTCVYFIGLLFSDVLYTIAVAYWNFGESGLIRLILYSFYFTCDNIFRIAVLYFVFKYSIVYRRTIIKF